MTKWSQLYSIWPSGYESIVVKWPSGSYYTSRVATTVVFYYFLFLSTWWYIYHTRISFNMLESKNSEYIRIWEVRREVKSDKRATDAAREQVSTWGTRGGMNSRKEQAGCECEACRGPYLYVPWRGAVEKGAGGIRVRGIKRSRRDTSARHKKEQAGYECEAWPRRYMMRVEVTEETTSCHWREIRRKYDRLSNRTRDF